MIKLDPDRAARVEHVVTEADIASVVGSGDVPSLATPQLLAWMEAATVEAIGGALSDGETTVGVRVEVDHVAPSPVGARIEVAAELVAVDGRDLTFAVIAVDDAGQTVGHGRVWRAVVGRERYLSRLSQ